MTRPILLDALDGACHRAYGSMPNMTWIFNQSAVPVYKPDWTNHFTVANAGEYCLHVGEHRQVGEKLAPFRVERLGCRDHDLAAFYRGLESNGPQAVAEFRAAFG